MDWRTHLFKVVARHLQRNQINLVTRGGLMAWWMNEHNQIFGEIEQIMDDEIAAEVLGELNSLAIIIGADARIDNHDPNTQRIIQVIDTFIKEIEQEVDFTDDEDKE